MIGGVGSAKSSHDYEGLPPMVDVLSSALMAVDGGSRKIDNVTAEKILPGARSFEDIQKYLDSAKKEKREKLKEQNKDFSKPTRRTWS